MTMELTDRVLYPSRGDMRGALAFLDDPDQIDRQFIDRLWHWCAVAGVDYSIAFAWFCVETANATSIRWTRDHNPGGIGIPANSTVQPFVIPDGDTAAQIHTDCYYAAVTGKAHPQIPLWPDGKNWLNKVWLPKVNDPKYPGVTTLTDLDQRYKDSFGIPQATWAWGFAEGQPSQTCIERAHAIWPDLPDQKEGSMALPSKPVIHDLATDYAKYGLEKWQADVLLSKHIPNRLGYQPQGIVWHIQDGSTAAATRTGSASPVRWMGVPAMR
jgi:hypothetical protein